MIRATAMPETAIIHLGCSSADADQLRGFAMGRR
jgi:hypothetical protein